MHYRGFRQIGHIFGVCQKSVKVVPDIITDKEKARRRVELQPRRPDTTAGAILSTMSKLDLQSLNEAFEGREDLKGAIQNAAGKFSLMETIPPWSSRRPFCHNLRLTKV